MSAMRKHVLRVAVGDPPTVTELLAARLALPLDRAREWVRIGAVQADGRRAVEATHLPPGTRVVVREPVVVATAPLVVAWRDELTLVVEKPAGMLAQPSEGEAASSLEARVRDELPSARMLHRLDRDASGLVLFALRPEAFAPLQRSIEEGLVERTYAAVASGEIAEPREIRLRIARDPSDARRRVALPENAPGGRAALTRLAPLGPGAGGTALRVELGTGRTHQIRVHLLAIGHPLVGDGLYGGPPAARLMLHAARLVFPHPATGGRVAVESPAPEGFGG